LDGVACSDFNWTSAEFQSFGSNFAVITFFLIPGSVLHSGESRAIHPLLAWSECRAITRGTSSMCRNIEAWTVTAGTGSDSGSTNGAGRATGVRVPVQALVTGALALSMHCQTMAPTAAHG
jgi:hypothetical protein